MRILFFNQYFSTPEGAHSTRAYEFARRWVEFGHQVTVVTSVYEKSDLRPTRLVSTLEIEGIEVKVLNIRLANRHGVAHRIATFLAYSVFASWQALWLPADVVLCSSGPITIGIPGLVAHWIRRRPLVFEVRDLWPEGAIQLGILRNRALIALARGFEALCYRRAAAVVALSPGQAADIAGRFELEILGVVPNASDNELADAVGTLEPMPDWALDRTLLVYAGALGLINGGIQLIELADELRRRGRIDLEMVIIGDGRELDLIHRRASELSLENVHFHDSLPRDQVFRWLNVARVSLFTVKDVPFLDTASPNKVFDAFACGVPVLQTTQGWIKQLLDEERCGVTVPPGDMAALADAVEQLVDDEPMWRELSQNARSVARGRFDRSLLANAMRRHLESAAR